METYVMCSKCTGLLPVEEEEAINNHKESCEGHIESSTCDYFSVNKAMLLALLGQDTLDDKPIENDEQDNKSIKEGKQKSGTCSRQTRRTQSMIKAGRRPKSKIKSAPQMLISESTNMSVKQEIEESTGDNVRRSKRRHKPLHRKDFETWEDLAEKGQINVKTEIETLQKISAITAGEDMDSDFQSELEDMSPNMLNGNTERMPSSTGAKYRDWKAKLFKKYQSYSELMVDSDGKSAMVYRCPKCSNRTFPSARVGLFSRHLSTCRPTGDPTLRCPEPGCDYVAKDSKRYSEHKRHHRQPYMCEYCSRRFADKRNMVEHRMTHTGELPYSCEFCEYRARNKRLMKEHQRKHTGNYEQCPEKGCTFSTPYHGSLLSHIQLKHRERTRYKCTRDACSYVTNSKSALDKHIAVHDGTKHFQCSLCPYNAFSKFAVISHMRSHTKEKIYFCNKCNYSASYASAFKQHMITHLGLKTWQCGECGYNSNTRAKVIRHLQSRHPDASVSTSVVNLGLSLKIDLKQYRKEKQSYTIVEAEDEKSMAVETILVGEYLVEQLVEVGGEEIVISQDLLVDNNELTVML